MMRTAVIAYLVIALTLTGCSSSPSRAPWARCRTCAGPNQPAEEPSWWDRQPREVRYALVALGVVVGIGLVGVGLVELKNYLKTEGPL